MKTTLPKSCPAAQHADHQCRCCWKVVKGKDYDFVNELCSTCSRALIHLEPNIIA